MDHCPFDFETVVPRRGSGAYKWDAQPPVQGLEEGADIIPMWVADMDFRTAPCIIEALQRRVGHGVFGYTQVPGSYYQAVRDWFSRRHGWVIDPSWILYTSGVVPAISATIKALTVPGDQVIVQTPVYNCFFSSIRNNGCVRTESPLLYENHTYRMDFEDLERKCADPKAKILLLCNPHNPAGRVWTQEELARTGEICRRHGVIVVSDEIHCELTLPGHTFTPFAAASKENQGCSITLNSPSKSFNTAGLQIANIITDNPSWLERIDRAININEVCDVNPFGVIALQAAYSPEGEAWLEALRDRIYKNYLILKDLFEKEAPDFPLCRLEGTYLVWVDCSALGDIASEAVEKSLIERERVWINAGSMYGQEGFIRINIACPETLLREGTRRIIRGLNRLLQNK